MTERFYLSFEDKYRGSRDLIKLRLRVYLPFIEPLMALYEEAKVVDLGCGRGEWLELLVEAGFQPYGVDVDPGMLAVCEDRGLNVELKDVIAALKELSDSSQIVVSGFHVVEHLPFANLQILVQEALRVLKPGGLLILETPNPENILVATLNFYLDPTHQRPIPPDLLSFLPVYYGFDRVKTLRLQEAEELVKGKTSLSLHDVLGGASPDYAVIAQKAANHDIFHSLDTAFNKEYGLSFAMLAAQYEEQLKAKAQQVETKAQEAEARVGQAEAKADEAHAKAQEVEARAGQAEAKADEAHAKAQEVEARAGQAEAKANEAYAQAQEAQVRAGQAQVALASIYNSRSWRITAPLRWAGNVARWFVRGSIAWVTFAPGSRPRRVLRCVLISIKSGISHRPLWKAVAARLLSFFPQIDQCLRSLGNPRFSKHLDTSFSTEDLIKEINYLTPRARQIYLDLKASIEQRQKEQR
jgi:O-antigen chain-terminating methyltransferase